MKAFKSRHAGVLATALVVGMVLAVGPALAEGSTIPAPPTPAPSTGTPSGTKATKSKKKTTQRSEQEFFDGYRTAYNLIQSGQYEAGILALRALDEDDHPDVANYIGYASRKLGRYDDARIWYERALASDPKHARTWQYYGMWHLEQGNMLKAQDHLQKIQAICGTGCSEYASLQEALNGNIVY